MLNKSWSISVCRLFAVLLLLCSNSLLAATQNYELKRWTTRDGLSSQSLRTIAQDRQGYIWAGSLFGLNRFDGNKFDVFNQQNTPDLVSNAISKLFLDSSGYIWIGTKGGLSGVDPDTLDFGYYPLQQPVTDISQTNNGQLWVAAEQLWQVNQRQFKQIEAVKGRVLLLDQVDEYLWVLTNQYLYLLHQNGQVLRSIYLPAKIAQAKIHDIQSNQQQGLWLATEVGLYQLDRQFNGFRQVNLPVSNGSEVFKLMRQDNDELWLSSMGLLHHTSDGKEWRTVVSAQYDHRGWFTDIFQDQQGNTWFASSSDGLWRANKSDIRLHLTKLLNGSQVDALVMDNQERLWIATKTGVFRTNGNNQYQLMIPGELFRYSSVYGIAFDGDSVLLASDAGAMIYQDGVITLPLALEPLQWSTARVLTPHRSNGFWLGTSQGLYQYSSGRLYPFKFNDQFVSKQITYVIDKGDNTWIGTTAGVYRFDGEYLYPAEQDNRVARAYISSIVDLAEHGILVATLDDGLFFYSDNTGWQHYDESNGLSSGIIVSLFYQHSENRVWVGTMNGVYRFNLVDLLQNDNSLLIENIVDSHERQLQQLAGYCCRGVGNHKVVEFNGSLWFSSKAGLVEIPSDISIYGDLSQRRSAMISHISTGKRRLFLAEQNKFQLSLNERDFTVFYSSLNFDRPHLERFRYKLQGYDEQWNEVGNLRQAVFTNLPAGQFNFVVEHKFANQSWQQALSASSAINIPQQFSETMLYRIMLGVLMLLLLYGVVQFNRNYERRRQERLELLVEQRTVELQLVNDKLNEANQQLKQLSHKDELTGLRNRYFVFEQLPKDIEHYQRNRESMVAQDKSFALILINVDGFKAINENYGSVAGDSALSQLAMVLTRETRGSDYVVRWGGDEFLIVLRDSQVNQIESFIYELNLAVANGEFYLPNGQSFMINCSIGYARYPLELIGGQLINWEVSLSLAEMALHHVKTAGSNGWATVEFEAHVDAFEFEDNEALESFVEQLLATGAARFNLRLARSAEY